MGKKVLFIAQEVSPYVPDSAMSSLGRKLAAAAMSCGYDIRTFMPKWGIVNERRNQLHEVIRLSGMNISINEVDHALLIKVASIQAARMQVYFIDNADYFNHRQMRCDESGNEYADNVERSIFYARGVLETVKKLRWFPDVVVCEGWMSYVVPFYIRTSFQEEPAFSNCKIVTSVFREQVGSPMPEDLLDAINYREGSVERLNETGIDFTQTDAMLRLAMQYSDGFINVAAPKELNAMLEETKKPLLKIKNLDNLKDQVADFYETL